MHTTPRHVPAVVHALASGLAAILGQRLVGVYLGGSAVTDDFVPASSDFDVLVVTEDLLTVEDLRHVEGLHQRLLAAHPDAERLEGDYAPRRLLVPGGTSAPVPGFTRGRFLPHVLEIMLSADNLANMRQSSVAVHGPPAHTVLPPVTPEDVRAAVLEMLREAPGPCATELDAAAEVLNLVRSLCTLETGQPSTKSRGAAWALIHLEERWHGLVRRADAVRRGEPVPDDHRSLRSALPALHHALRARARGALRKLPRPRTDE